MDYFLIGLGVGIIVGIILMVFMIAFRVPPVGTLRVDKSDIYDGPHLFLELDKGIHEIVNRKYVLLKVRDEDLISRE